MGNDIVLFVPMAPELQKMLQEVSAASIVVGLQMNLSKIQLITNGRKCKVKADGQEIQYIEEYLHLGQLASFENRQEKEIDHRIDNARKS